MLTDAESFIPLEAVAGKGVPDGSSSRPLPLDGFFLGDLEVRLLPTVGVPMGLADV